MPGLAGDRLEELRLERRSLIGQQPCGRAVAADDLVPEQPCQRVGVVPLRRERLDPLGARVGEDDDVAVAALRRWQRAEHVDGDALPGPHDRHRHELASRGRARRLARLAVDAARDVRADVRAERRPVVVLLEAAERLGGREVAAEALVIVRREQSRPQLRRHVEALRLAVARTRTQHHAPVLVELERGRGRHHARRVVDRARELPIEQVRAERAHHGVASLGVA